MQYFRAIFGSIIFGLGTMGTVWFLRNLLRRRMRQARFYRESNPIVVFIVNLILLIGGLWIYSDFERIPFLALFLGAFLGWGMSR